jgi:type II secretory pathway component PulM
MPPFATPALPLHEAGKYVAGAYIVFLVLVVIYVAIMAAKLQRIERELRELATFAETRSEEEPKHEEVGAR